MRIYLATVVPKMKALKAGGIRHGKWHLTCYHEVKRENLWQEFLDFSDAVLVDSGAHGLQRGSRKIEWDDFTEEYADWIVAHDTDKVVGYFEMDVDNIIGIPKVEALRRRLKRKSKKIIEVWHRAYGWKGYVEMLRRNRGRIVGLPVFGSEDIKEEQVILFIQEAWKRNVRIHGLGCTRRRILRKIPFDSVDSSTWYNPVKWGQLQTIPGTIYIKKDTPISSRTALGYRTWLDWQKLYDAKGPMLRDLQKAMTGERIGA